MLEYIIQESILPFSRFFVNFLRKQAAITMAERRIFNFTPPERRGRETTDARLMVHFALFC